MGFLTLAALALMGSGIFLMRRNLKAIGPGPSQIMDTFSQMEQVLPLRQEEMAPLGETSLELLAANPRKQQPAFRSKGMESVVIGTLYEEPGVALVWKRFNSKDMKALAVGRDSINTYRFLFKSAQVEATVDGQPLGIFYRTERVLRGLRTGVLLASLHPHPSQGESLRLQDREVLILPKDVMNDPSQLARRAFVMLVNSLGAEERAIILTVFLILFLQEKYTL